MTVSTESILHWAAALWHRGAAVAAWRSHYEKLRAELAAPERASAERVAAAEETLRETSDAYNSEPSEVNRVTLKKATAAVPLAQERHFRDFGEQHLSGTWRLEKLANLDLLERAITEAETELQSRFTECENMASKLAAEVGTDPAPIVGLIDSAFEQRAQNLQLAATAVRHSRHNRANPSATLQPAGAEFAHSALETALKV